MASVASQIVDFNALANEKNVERRSELACHVAMLFSRTSDRCSDEQMDIYDEVMLRLSDLVQEHARAYMAECLADLRRAPEQTVRKLADDEIGIAEPLLSRSAILKERDLLEIASGKSDEHRLAIAKRQVISEPLADVLVNKGNTPVRQQVASNEGAMLSNGTIDTLMQEAQSDEIIQLALGGRADLADYQIEKLISFASEEVRQTLLEKGEAENVSRLPQAAKFAAQKLTNEFWIGRYDFETAQARVYAVAREGQLGETTLRRYAEEDRFPEVVAAFSVIAGIGYEEAKHWMVRNDTEPFLVVAKANNLSVMTIQAILKIGPWRYRLTQKMREVTLNRYQHMERPAAQRMLRDWHERWAR